MIAVACHQVPRPLLRLTKMHSVCVGIPTHIRHDLCHRCIESIMANRGVDIQRIYVIDNYGGFDSKVSLVNVIRPTENLGVARSWNIFHMLTRPSKLIISNDDVVLNHNAIASMIDYGHDFVGLTHDGGNSSAWACFYQSENIWDKVGNYDEFFWPAYFEDNDYHYRMKLAGFEASYLTGHSTHEGSATLKSIDQIHKDTMERCFKRSKSYYISKWGGEPGKETFTSPFNSQGHK